MRSVPVCRSASKTPINVLFMSRAAPYPKMPRNLCIIWLYALDVVTSGYMLLTALSCAFCGRRCLRLPRIRTSNKKDRLEATHWVFGCSGDIVDSIMMNRSLGYTVAALCCATGVCVIVYCTKEVGLPDIIFNPISRAEQSIRRETGQQLNPAGTGNESKVILTWTTWFGDRNWGYGALGDVPFRTCENKNCIATSDKAFVDKAHLLLFHCRDDVTKWPTSRRPDQIYAAECQESPTYSNMDIYNQRVNISVTYRLDSDVVFPYFEYASLTSKLPEPYIPKVPFAGRTGDAVWPVSHCRAPSNRDQYAEELMKYINVDIYGSCGKHTCHRNKHQECLDKFEKKYKFLLSFENTFCDGYVTEKFSNGLVRDIIPIVYSAADYSKVAPPHSYIDTRDFLSPKELALYLEKISNNETLFNEYFQWKRNYTIIRPNMMCEVCKFLHENKDFHKDATSFQIAKWWKPPGICDNSIFNPSTHTMKLKHSI